MTHLALAWLLVVATTYTSAELLTIIIALGGLTTIIGGVVVNVVVAIKTKAKVDEVNTKADVITGHVNSAAAEARTTIEGLQREIVQLREIMADKKETAALLAQSVVRPPESKP